MIRNKIKFSILVAAALMQFSCSSSKLIVESEPSGSNVYINDKLVGRTPIALNYKDLPYEDNLNFRVEKDNYGTLNAIVEGPRRAELGEKIHFKIPKNPDETALLNNDLERMMEAHRLALSRRFTEATRVVDQMIADHPNLVAAQMLRGSILFMNRNFASAQEQYQKVLEIDPSNVEATKMLNYMNDKHLVSDRAVAGGASK